MSNTFRDYVTSTAFALTISRRQIEMLSQLHQFGDSWMLITTFDALARKGLVERVQEKNGDQFSTTARLTEAGRLRSQDHHKLHRQLTQEIVAGFDSTETVQLAALLRKALDRF